MEWVKIYGLCLERLSHQIKNAKQRKSGAYGWILIESYNTGNIEDIIDILELYDIKVKTQEVLERELQDLAYTVSELVREVLTFAYTGEGHLGLHLYLGEPNDRLHVQIDTDAQCCPK